MKALLLIVLLAVVFTSCRSNRPKPDFRPEEKVVILERTVTLDMDVPYKVKRLSNSTVTWIFIRRTHQYVPKDTIMWRFN